VTPTNIGRRLGSSFRFLPVLFFALLFASCAAPNPAAGTVTESAPTATVSPAYPPTLSPAAIRSPTVSPAPRPKVERVVIISLDGLRPDGLLRANIPRISALINGGASSFSAQTILPSATLPAHASMLSGRCVSKHGIIWNDLIPSKGYIQGSTIFSVAKDAGLWTIMVVGKEKLVTIARPGTVDRFRYVDGSDEQIVKAALVEASGGFGVLFVHLYLPDLMGHSYGWMSAPYIKIIDRDDTAVGTLFDGLQTLGLVDGTLFILTADHGGHDLTHGTAQMEDTTIPWIIYGPGVLPGVSLTVPVSVMDTAATGVWALGLTLPADWDGRPVVEAFGLEDPSAPASAVASYRCIP
jgi:Type I phosphodiesterase / nucleotide pyrophosphatase